MAGGFFFATAVERVIQKFKEASVKLAAFELYIPHLLTLLQVTAVDRVRKSRLLPMPHLQGDP